MARALDGTGDFYTQAAAAVTAYPFTFGLLFKATTAATASGLMQICDGTSTHDWSLECAGTANGYRFRRSDAGGAVAATSSATVTDATWTSIVGVATSATDTACFINGTAKGTNATSRTPVSVNATKIGDTTVRAELAGSIAAAFILDIAAADADVALLTVTAGSVYRSPLLITAWSGHVIRYWKFSNTATGNETDVKNGAVMVENGNPTNGASPTVIEPGAVAGNSYRRRRSD